MHYKISESMKVPVNVQKMKEVLASVSAASHLSHCVVSCSLSESRRVSTMPSLAQVGIHRSCRHARRECSVASAACLTSERMRRDIRLSLVQSLRSRFLTPPRPRASLRLPTRMTPRPPSTALTPCCASATMTTSRHPPKLNTQRIHAEARPLAHTLRMCPLAHTLRLTRLRGAVLHCAQQLGSGLG
jgi:hypothetical protein